jgi:hypothetical protein
MATTTLLLGAIIGTTAARTNRGIAADGWERKADGGNEVDEEDTDLANPAREEASPGSMSCIPHDAHGLDMRFRLSALMLCSGPAMVKRQATKRPDEPDGRRGFSPAKGLPAPQS